LARLAGSKGSYTLVAMQNSVAPCPPYEERQ
jgi:hypothetical protein